MALPHTFATKAGTVPGSALDEQFAAIVPPGGTTGQVLAKASSEDHDAEWVDQTGGGGGGDVASVNGQTGVVVLTKSSVGLSNVDNTSDSTKNSATRTLTNASISGADNTLSAIPVDAIVGLAAGATASKSSSAQAITGTNDTTWMTPATTAAALDAAGVTPPTEGTLAAGSTTITRADHLNRPVRLNPAATGVSTGVLNTGIADLVAGDFFYLRNPPNSTGIFVVTGTAVVVPVGKRRTCMPGEDICFSWDAATDTWTSTSDISRQGAADGVSLLGHPLNRAGAYGPQSTWTNTNGTTVSDETAWADDLFCSRVTTESTASAAANQLTALRSSSSGWAAVPGSSTKQPPIAISFTWGVADAILNTTGVRQFVGIGTSTVPCTGTTEPSTLLNIVGFACDTDDTQLSLMHNDGSGPATEVAMGAAFKPHGEKTDMYQGWIVISGGATRRLQAFCINHNTGDMFFHSTTSDIPAAGTEMIAYYCRNSGAEATLKTRLASGWTGGGNFALLGV